MTTSIVAGSLSAIARDHNVSLAESFLSCDALILFDSSGSMDACDSRGGQRRFDVAQEELRRLQATHPGKIGLITFSSWVEFTPGGEPYFMGGGTDLAGALRFVQVADGCGIRFIVVSDGEPDSESETLRVAKSFTSPIDTVFVGPEGGHGAAFLRDLAAAHRGRSVVAEKAVELAERVETLLLT